eukprot:6027651-Pleurochrysis_carterae.AAC.1
MRQSTARTPPSAARPPISDAAGQIKRCTVIRPFGICARARPARLLFAPVSYARGKFRAYKVGRETGPMRTAGKVHAREHARTRSTHALKDAKSHCCARERGRG